MEGKQSYSHTILGGALVCIGLFAVFSLVMIHSYAETTQVTIINFPPSVSSIIMSSTGTTDLTDDYSGGTINDLVAGSTKSVWVNGVVTDPNGEDDITTVDLVFYRDDKGTSCGTDKNDCYKITECTFDTSYGTTDEASYSCPLDIYFFTDSTVGGGTATENHWVTSVTVQDDATNSFSFITKEMGLLLALDIPSTIDFGTMALGAGTTNDTNIEQTITQQGNDVADVTLVMTDAEMSCSVRGSVPRESIEWSATDSSYGDASSHDLTGISTDTDIGVGYRTSDGTALTRKLYWNIKIPSSGVEGICSSTNLTITAIAA